MKSSNYAIIDQSDSSLIYITFTGSKATDASFKRYLDELESCYDERNYIGKIFDATNATIPKLRHQKLQAKWIERNWLLLKTYCKGTAYVIPSTTLRTVLKMILSMQNQPVPYKIFSDIESAKEWLNSLESKKVK
ncbi:STAS/SEC14 domain-containing protein [Marivirga sp. S37H4]|uniref:STAS/SEC14 domain-containing protein n=1 Tax=Marivirga aurantiaca TaxID=2802615 RepID=A0A934X1G4_9BACT|nr:STAS/SEC14 domain-containing protein [Marivirga aurantiaca]MBK6266707.1 STAS/SEC14 domain-containing protein [Marivirga aurantiaca]